MGLSQQHGTELWRMDPDALVLEVFDLVPGIGSSYPFDLVEAGGALYLHATWQGASRLLRFDAQGTMTDLAVLGGPGFPGNLWPVVAVGDRVFFELDGDPWITDGTLPGTRMLADLSPPQGSPPFDAILHPVAAGGAVYFWHHAHAGAGPGLYRATIDPDGAQLIAAPAPPTAQHSPYEELFPIGSGDRIGYRGWTPQSGTELWVTGGGPPELAADLAPGPPSSTPDLDPAFPDPPVPFVPTAWQRAGAHFLVQGDDGATGLEPHALPVAALGGWVAETFGPSCGEARMGHGGSATAGGVLTVELETVPLAPALLFAGPEPALIPLSNGCAQLVTSPALLGLVVSADTGLVAVPLAVPADPLFAGLHLAFQWVVFAPAGLLLSDALEVVIGI